jgi:hypothetical protein
VVLKDPLGSDEQSKRNKITLDQARKKGAHATEKMAGPEKAPLENSSFAFTSWLAG